MRNPKLMTKLICPVCKTSFFRYKSYVKRKKLALACSRACREIRRRPKCRALGANKLWRKKVSEATKKAMNQPDIRLRHLEGLGRAFGLGTRFSHHKATPFFSVLRSSLESAGFITERFKIGVYTLDFAHAEAKVNIEYDGTSHLTGKRKKTDAKRDATLKSWGWKVIRVSHTA